jgi:hypothetical protein
MQNRLKKATQKALAKMPVRKLKADDRVSTNADILKELDLKRSQGFKLNLWFIFCQVINETCAICLENFTTSDSIRELPCG